MTTKEERLAKKNRRQESGDTGQALHSRRVTPELLARLDPDELRQQILNVNTRLEKALGQLKSSRAEI